MLGLAGDNASSNDTQTASLAAETANSFEEINRVRCFNHTMQLSAKTMLRLFDSGPDDDENSRAPAIPDIDDPDDDDNDNDNAVNTDDNPEPTDTSPEFVAGDYEDMPDLDEAVEMDKGGDDDEDDDEDGDDDIALGPDEFDALNEMAKAKLLNETKDVKTALTKVPSDLD
jgi:hypothetical protein